jgi:hypothetical protein
MSKRDSLLYFNENLVLEVFFKPGAPAARLSWPRPGFSVRPLASPKKNAYYVLWVQAGAAAENI